MNTKAAIDKETQKNIDQWLSGSYDATTKAHIRELQQNNPQELIDSFYQRLSFGTGGLRGIMGVGTNRMNQYTVNFATQGLANYINKQPKTTLHHKVLIGYDSRNNSRFFAEETAKVLAANNIEVFLYQEMRPVALVSFGLMHKGCIAAVMITASHNPREYNGYKVWWSNGAQVLPPHDRGIIKEVDQITDPSMVKSASAAPAPIHKIGDEIDLEYLKTVRALQLHPSLNQTEGKNLHIIYTPLHGAGITMVPKTLADWGFTTLSLVEKQCMPDGNFPTVKNPNPEEPEALEMGIEQLRAVKGDILLATDPDSDRLAVVVMHHEKPFSFNGNEVACLILEYICQSMQEEKKVVSKPMFIKTIVTTELFRAIVEHYKAECLDVLTGFKYIGEKIALWEEEKKSDVAARHYIFGGEESYGYLYGTHARDKDAIICSAIISEMACYLKSQGETLVDLLNHVYEKYGVYREKLASLTFEGKAGMEKMQEMMARLRKNPPTKIGNAVVSRFEDYLIPKEPLLLPKSDVLRFWLSDHTKIVVRPSGTEPKIKIYCACYDNLSGHTPQQAIEACDKQAEEYLNLVKQMLQR